MTFAIKCTSTNIFIWPMMVFVKFDAKDVNWYTTFYFCSGNGFGAMIFIFKHIQTDGQNKYSL